MDDIDVEIQDLAYFLSQALREQILTKFGDGTHIDKSKTFAALNYVLDPDILAKELNTIID